MTLLAVLGIFTMGGTSYFIAWNLFSGEIEGAAQSRLAMTRKPPKNGLLKLCRPLLTSLVMPYTMRLNLEDWKKKNKRMIVSAGLEEELDADELLAFKVFLGGVVPLCMLVYFQAMGIKFPWWATGLIAIFLFMYPSFWISGAKKNRHVEIKLQLPFVIDLLTLSTEAGLDFIGALMKVVEKTRSGPFVQEIERMLQEIQLGTSRADAMRNLAWRIDLQEISSLIAVLVTADQMGSPLGGVLRVQADLIRLQRFVTAEKKGATASQKILFPLIFFIMPAVFIMIFGPVILGFFGAK